VFTSQSVSQSILLPQLVRTPRATIQTRHHLTRPCSKSHLRKSAAPECGHRFDRGLVETLGGNANGVLDAFGVGEETKQERTFGTALCEGKANLAWAKRQGSGTYLPRVFTRRASPAKNYQELSHDYDYLC